MSAPRPFGRGALCAKPMYRSEKTVPRRKSFFRQDWRQTTLRTLSGIRGKNCGRPLQDARNRFGGELPYLLLMHGTVGSNRLRARTGAQTIAFCGKSCFSSDSPCPPTAKSPRAVGAGAKTGISRRKPVSFKNQTVVRFIRASVRLPPKARQPLHGGSSSACIPRRAHDRRRRIFRRVPTRPLPRPCAPTLSTYLLRFP